MKSASYTFVWILFLINNLKYELVDGYSACDPTDVFFLIDTASIKADSDGLIKLIDSVNANYNLSIICIHTLHIF